MRDRKAHLDLANRFAGEPEESPLRWEEMYHRVRASDHEGVCRLADQRRLRDQVFLLRPLDAVCTDVELALPSAAACDDVRAFAALHSSGPRSSSECDCSKTSTCQGCCWTWATGGKPQRRLVTAIVPASAQTAMGLAVRLADAGAVAEARRLFEVAEPLDMLAGQTRQGVLDVWHPLGAWAEAAPRFRPLAGVLDAISAAPLGELNQWRNDEGFEARLRSRLLVRAGHRLIAECRVDELEELLVHIPAKASRAVTPGSGCSWRPPESATVTRRGAAGSSTD